MYLQMTPALALLTAFALSRYIVQTCHGKQLQPFNKFITVKNDCFRHHYSRWYLEHKNTRLPEQKHYTDKSQYFKKNPLISL